MGCVKAMGNSNGIMEKPFKESGEMARKMAMEFGDPLKEIPTKENGE